MKVEQSSRLFRLFMRKITAIQNEIYRADGKAHGLTSSEKNVTITVDIIVLNQGGDKT